jgi:hypothetical protein
LHKNNPLKAGYFLVLNLRQFNPAALGCRPSADSAVLAGSSVRHLAVIFAKCEG